MELELWSGGIKLQSWVLHELSKGNYRLNQNQTTEEYLILEVWSYVVKCFRDCSGSAAWFPTRSSSLLVELVLVKANRIYGFVTDPQQSGEQFFR